MRYGRLCRRERRLSGPGSFVPTSMPVVPLARRHCPHRPLTHITDGPCRLAAASNGVTCWRRSSRPALPRTTYRRPRLPVKICSFSITSAGTGCVLVLHSAARDPQVMSEAAPTPIELPPKSPERLAEIRALHERIRQGDESGTVAWEEVAAELGLPSSS